MKNYIVGIFSSIHNKIKHFRVSSQSYYDAVKLAMIMFCSTDKEKSLEIEFQKSEDYPSDLCGLHSYYKEITFSVIEI